MRACVSHGQSDIEATRQYCRFAVVPARKDKLEKVTFLFKKGIFYHPEARGHGTLKFLEKGIIIILWTVSEIFRNIHLKWKRFKMTCC
jgi:hypothetical protein